MSAFSRGALRAAANAPAVAAGYAAIAFLVVRTGCTPPFLDTEVFGVPVTSFLLLALTVTALILILFAGLHAWRTLRVSQRHQRGERRAAAAAGIGLAVAAFLAVAGFGALLLRMPCA